MIFKTEFDTVLLWEECEGKANLMSDAGCRMPDVCPPLAGSSFGEPTCTVRLAILLS